MDSDEGSELYASDIEHNYANILKEAETDGLIDSYKPSFDVYFTHASSRTRTSTNVFSQRVVPLSPEEYNAALARAPAHAFMPKIPFDNSSFKRWARELDEGFNLLFYGLGSKRSILNDFAKHVSRRGHVAVVNAFHPSVTVRDMLASIARVPGVQSTSTSAPSLERVAEHFAGSDSPHLFLIVHSLDRSPKLTRAIASLALSPHIHIAASIDRLNAPLLFSASQLAARKGSVFSSDRATKNVGYGWLWHDLTTLAPYTSELAFADRTSISGASASRSRVDVTNPASGPLTETAAMHVLAAVTAKAKKLFSLLAAKQLENADSSDDSEANSARNPNDQQHLGLTYDALFTLARDAFIATNDTAFRALLGEFRDHGLVVSAAQPGTSGSEVLWIPLRRERLSKLVGTLDGART
ncbi:origin recognition complex subunit 2 [Suillus paluster]|uniref:origin recognition complex subunit 2 n=1 Tax=Suillus paluster TaxID=48578 RepID=UPI001B866944|nr:origin recognition complex subunit 2 [Suillus paluster]KAG1725777.1 origin recognition complex subunit 2 [Suillus paluster]